MLDSEHLKPLFLISLTQFMEIHEMLAYLCIHCTAVKSDAREAATMMVSKQTLYTLFSS